MSKKNQNQNHSADTVDPNVEENQTDSAQQEGTPKAEDLRTEEEIEHDRMAGGSLEADANRDKATKNAMENPEDSGTPAENAEAGQDANSNSEQMRSSTSEGGGPNGDGQMGADKIEAERQDNTSPGMPMEESALGRRREAWKGDKI